MRKNVRRPEDLSLPAASAHVARSARAPLGAKAVLKSSTTKNNIVIELRKRDMKKSSSHPVLQ
jgi:hypothetical protein